MRMVQAFVPSGLCLAALALATGCSGTPDQADPTGQPAEFDDVTNAAPAEPGTSMPESGMQDPGAQQPRPVPQGQGEERMRLLIERSITQAKRSLEMRLFGDAAQVAAEVLEMDPSNDTARQILLDAQAAMGNQGAGVEREFLDRVRQGQVALQRVLSEVRREMNMGDAEMEQGRFGDAVEHYKLGLLQLRYSPYQQPGSDLQAQLETKLDAARQSQMQAERADDEARAAASRAQLAAEEEEMRIQQSARVKRLLETANFDFQLGRYRESVNLLDQALLVDPNNGNALALRDLAERARHENRLDVLRADWRAEWSKTFDELNSLDIPQTDPIVYDLARWRKVQERTPLEFAAPEDLESPEEKAIIAKLEATKIEHRFASATVQDWASYYAGVTDVTFMVTPGVRDDLDPETTTLKDFSLPSMSVHQALEVIGNVTGVRWKVESGVVKLVTPEQAGGKVYLRQYEVRDIVQGVADKPGPELKLKSPGEEAPFVDEEGEEPAPTVVDVSKLMDLIRANIDPESWDTNGTSINEQRGVLLVRHNRDVHGSIDNLLADLRGAVGIQVDIESRFLQVEDQFLEDIGVDFRGLGNQAASGVPGRGLENRTNAGFDDFGLRNQTNAATPGELGTGTEPGFFYDDGGDGDIMARTENLFDNTLGGDDTLDNSGGLALQYAFLDDAELEVVLRAVSKQERSQVITAPRLLVYNNARANMSVLRHTSFIRDFDVEIAQAAAVANPIIDVVRDGVVLDVRPVVSADRRFITMELRPTVMTLELPIPTFTTGLGVGQPISIQLPRVTLQRVRTTVTMPDGGTLMLGGMKLAQKQSQVSQVPILGDLPGLSFLFSRRGTFNQNKKILILIRATIVVPSEHVPELGMDDYEATLLGTR